MNWVPTTDAERAEMLDAIGITSIEDMFSGIPQSLRLKHWDVPAGRSEMSVRAELAQVAQRNRPAAANFLGGGFYDHFIPAAVDALSSRSEFYTAYTPYQPECSQGTLQAIYEYQSAVCRLTEMECANASLYDGGTAVFEAATMAVRLTKRQRVICHRSLNPRYRSMLLTHSANLDMEITDDGALDDSSLATAACVIVQNPAFLGTIEDFTELAERCHKAKALLVVSFYPISLGLLKTPGEMSADIAVAEGQSLGLPLGFGGPYLGIMTARKAHIRKMPGRIAAATTNGHGRVGYVLTLQAREQHIRREKAMSNICSNEALCALRALIYLCLLGKEGLREVATHCHSKAEYLKARLSSAGHVQLLSDGPTFNEFAVRLSENAETVVARLLERGIHAGLPLASIDPSFDARDLLIAVTEKRTREELDALAPALEGK